MATMKLQCKLFNANTRTLQTSAVQIQNVQPKNTVCAEKNVQSVALNTAIN